MITDERSMKLSARLFGRNCERRSLTSPRTTPSLKKAATNAGQRNEAQVESASTAHPESTSDI